MTYKQLDMLVRCKLEENENWRKWIKEIPYISFPSEWTVKVIPPFGGAMARFLVKRGEKEVSVYLDCYGVLGACDIPYWEVYPYNDDVYRCDMNNVEELIGAIKYVLEEKIDANFWQYFPDKEGGFIGSATNQICDFREGMGEKYGKIIADSLNSQAK